MKKQWIWIGWGLLALLAIPLWLFEGCSSSFPTASSVGSASVTSTTVSNFNQGTLNTNPSFSPTGYFSYQATGGAPGYTNMIDGSLTPEILVPNTAPAAGGSSYAIHIWGIQYDYCGNPNPPGTLLTEYPAFQVFCYLKNDPSNPYMDLSGFTGIQFLEKIAPPVVSGCVTTVSGCVTTGDTNVPPYAKSGERRFAIGIAPQVPAATAPGGTCPPPFSNNCYNYFWQSNGNPPPSLPVGNSTVNNGWVTFSIALNNLAMDSGYGNNPGVPAGQGQWNSNPEYAKKALFLLWKFTDNGSCVNTYTDFWIDNVQFY
jgi:hypothetical protein